LLAIPKNFARLPRSPGEEPEPKGKEVRILDEIPLTHRPIDLNPTIAEPGHSPASFRERMVLTVLGKDVREIKIGVGAPCVCGCPVIGYGRLHFGEKTTQVLLFVVYPDHCDPWGAAHASVLGPLAMRSAAPDVLGLCAYAKVFAAIIQTVVVEVIDNKPGARLHDEPVHTDGLFFDFSLGVDYRARFIWPPTKLSNPLVIVVINEREVPLC
jgi:hypothetical protein